MFKVIRKFFAWLKRITDKEFEFLKKNAGIAVRITGLLKELVESPLSTVIVSITPTDLDNVMLEKARRIVPIVAYEIALAHGLIQQNKSQSEVLEAIVAHLKTKVPDGRIGFWIEFSGRVNAALSDGKITIGEGAGIAQLVYSELYHKTV